MVTGAQGLIAVDFPMLYTFLSADTVEIVERVQKDAVTREFTQNILWKGRRSRNKPFKEALRPKKLKPYFQQRQ